MKIDGFTIVAQILNFVVLLMLLRRFLYGPILRAMKRRQDHIDAELARAESARAEAEQTEKKYDAMVADLDHRKDDLMQEAVEAARKRADDLAAQARKRLENREREWNATLERELDKAVETFRDRVRDTTVQALRRALGDLADETLEARVVDSFVAQIGALSDDEVHTLLGDEPDRPLQVLTAFDLDTAATERLRAAIAERFGDSARLETERDPSLVAGIELRCAGHRIGWNFAEYLDGLRRDIADAATALKRPVEPEGAPVAVATGS